MGCGKSSVGRELARLLCCPFMDLDEVIEGAEGRSIPEIFASDGEAAFRRMEAEHLQTLLDSNNVASVVALGGGTVMTRECAEMVREKTTCIYLRASVETLAGRLADQADGRPLLAGTSLRGAQRRSNLQGRIEEMLALRSGTYEQTAHMVIDTDGKSIADIAMEIHRNIEKIS